MLEIKAKSGECAPKLVERKIQGGVNHLSTNAIPPYFHLNLHILMADEKKHRLQGIHIRRDAICHLSWLLVFSRLLTKEN